MELLRLSYFSDSDQQRREQDGWAGFALVVRINTVRISSYEVQMHTNLVLNQQFPCVLNEDVTPYNDTVLT